MSKELSISEEISESKRYLKQKRNAILEDIEELDYSGGSSFLPSSYLKAFKKEEEKKNEEPKVIRQEDKEADADDWFATLESLYGRTGKKERPKTLRKEIFDLVGGKKKKKKKQKEGEPVNYQKEFAPEISLLHNLLGQQTKFVNALQRDYDSIADRKSTNRYNTKNLNDLIANITSARSLASQIVDKQVSVKKLISELTLKQKKELGVGNVDSNLNDYASSFLKQMIGDRRALSGDYGPSEITDYNDEELTDQLSNALSDYEEINDETMQYLKYENQKVNICVVIHNNNPEDYSFVALDADNQEIPDYPLPMQSKLTINYNTNIATDSYGEKYHVLYDNES